MPQPFPKSLGYPYIEIGKAPAQRPVLAARGMCVIAAWAQAEANLTLVLSNLLGSNSGPASSIFNTLRGNRLQIEAILNVAHDILDEEDMSIFKAVISLYKTAAKGRDKIAHHIWAIDNKIPNSVILVDPRDFSTINRKASLLQNGDDLSQEETLILMEQMRSICQVWK